MESPKTIITQPVPSITADRMLARRMLIEYVNGRWTCEAELNWYTEDADGNKTFATEDGQRVRDWIVSNDVLADAANVPELAQAFSALEIALAAAYAWKLSNG